MERRLHEKESLIAVISKERKQLDEQVKELEGELKRLEDQMESHKKLMEDEIIRRVEAENRAQTLEEEAAFNSQIHSKVLIFPPFISLATSHWFSLLPKATYLHFFNHDYKLQKYRLLFDWLNAIMPWIHQYYLRIN